MPGQGTAWEPVPGPTPFTRDSELQNAETSAWGRAIAALGFKVKDGIASAEDVRNRTGQPAAQKPAAMTAQQKDWLATLLENPDISRSKVEAACQRDYGHGINDLTGPEAATLIDQLQKFLASQKDVA